MSHIYNMYDGDARCTDPKVESKCFESRVTSRITRCSALSLRTLVDQRLPPNIIDFCDRQECNIKCYEDAVSLCSMKDQYVELDPVAVKVSYRVSCDKKEELKTAVAECTIRNMTCSADFQDLQTEANKLLQHTNNTAYRQALCRATSKFLECLDYVVAGNCTNEMATLMKDIMTVAFSYAKCGPQDHAYFSKYGGDTKCVTSGSWKSMISILLFGMTALLLVRL
ncbi:uncharacterized protein LOC123564892 [Mercenaria mercenaria]|uniref:uncharacterized protein LOC123564892 n=1 Tax=Mercenaria mercenaria TaxID=6596 RepID=UPI00234EE6D5|nr:uncharacterized protein LOC123564892 [Mercenaria mercenaria]